VQTKPLFNGGWKDFKTGWVSYPDAKGWIEYPKQEVHILSRRFIFVLIYYIVAAESRTTNATPFYDLYVCIEFEFRTTLCPP